MIGLEARRENLGSAGRGSVLKKAVDRTSGWTRLQEHEAVEGG
jgi:hypothetical protein